MRKPGGSRPIARLIGLAVGIACGFLLLHLWGGGSWGDEQLNRNLPEATYLPWVRQWWLALGAVVAGAALSAVMRRADWRAALKPWVLAGALLYIVSALAIAAVPKFSVVAYAPMRSLKEFTPEVRRACRCEPAWQRRELRRPRAVATMFGTALALALLASWLEADKRAARAG